MKFIKGFFVGTLVGFGIGSAMTDEQRTALRDRTQAFTRKQTHRVGEAVSRQADDIATTTTDRVVDTVDRAGEAVTSKIDSGGVSAAG